MQTQSTREDVIELELIPIPILPDGDSQFINLTGGLRACRIEKDKWHIDPIYFDGITYALGPFSKSELIAFTKKFGLGIISVRDEHVDDGIYSSRTTPISMVRKQNHIGPIQIWRNISLNLSNERYKNAILRSNFSSWEELDQFYDQADPVETISRYIASSLHAMAICVDDIHLLYHRHLTERMLSDSISDLGSADTTTAVMHAHVHSFFMHIGSVRDYLGRLLNFRYNSEDKPKFTMNNFIDKLKANNLPDDEVMRIILQKDNIVFSPQAKKDFERGGWLQDVTALRDRFVHKAPYGSRAAERSTAVIQISLEYGLYRCFREIQIDGNDSEDLLDVVWHHLLECNDFMYDVGVASGYNSSISQFIDSDFPN